MPSNQWGPYFPGTNGGQVNNNAPPPAQSPSGSVTGQSAKFNFDNTITSTREFLDNVMLVENTQQGAPALNVAVQIAGCSSVQQNKWY